LRSNGGRRVDNDVCFRQLKLQLFRFSPGFNTSATMASADIPPQYRQTLDESLRLRRALIGRVRVCRAKLWEEACRDRRRPVETCLPRQAFGGHRADRPGRRGPRGAIWLGPPATAAASSRSKSRCACAGMISIFSKARDPVLQRRSFAQNVHWRRPGVDGPAPRRFLRRSRSSGKHTSLAVRLVHPTRCAPGFDEHYQLRIKSELVGSGGAGPIGGAAAQVGDQIESHFLGRDQPGQ